MKFQKILIVFTFALMAATLLSTRADAALTVANNLTDKYIKIEIVLWVSKGLGYSAAEGQGYPPLELGPGENGSMNPSTYHGCGIYRVRVLLMPYFGYNGTPTEIKTVEWSAIAGGFGPVYGASITCRPDASAKHGIKCDIYPM